MRHHETAILGLLYAGLAGALTYASNQVEVIRDSEKVAANFPEVEGVELYSPAFATPGSVPETFANGTSGPTDQATLEYYLQTLAGRNDWMTHHNPDFKSEEGRSIPYVYLSTSTRIPEDGLESHVNSSAPGKVRIWMQGGVHGNEPGGDQALLALLGKFDANATWAASILDKVDIMMLPRYNPDGVAYFQRYLATGFDPNRDHTKLARRQTRDIKRLVMSFAPHVGIDCHEYSPAQGWGARGQWIDAQDGQFSAMKNANIHADIRNMSEAVFAGAVAAAMERRGLRWGPYVVGLSGATDEVVMEETTGDAKIGDSSVALSQAIMFLTETRGIGLADQHFRRRVAAGLTMVEAIVQTAADHAGEVYRTVEGARAKFAGSTEDIVVTESSRPTDVSWRFIDSATGSLVDVPVRFLNTTPVVANLTRARPAAYVFSGAWADMAERLRVAGVAVRTLEHDFRGEVEALNVTGVSVAAAKYEGVARSAVETAVVRKEVSVPAGGFWVSNRQKSAAHAFVTLEPEGIDSYATFNILPVSVGDEYPVYRVMA